MKVYVVEVGVYENEFISGVYATPEAAMAAHPAREAKAPASHGRDIPERPGGWHKTKYGWNNGLDWDDAAHITEYEVEQ